MKRHFKRTYLASHAPSFAQAVDEWQSTPEGKVPKGSRKEGSMLHFLKQHGFPMNRVNKYGFGVSTDEMGGVTIESV